jgi:glycosyltransferase involved in cell wall biosynthesis
VSGVHHFVPVLHRGDAVGRHTLRLRNATRARGIASNIYVGTTDSETADETLPAAEYAEAARRGDVVVYQFATASFVAPWLAARSETLVVNYHNITPPEYVSSWDPHLALGQARAQEELRLLAPRTTLAVADSAYNEAHLAVVGFASTAVIPPSAAMDRSDADGEETPVRTTVAREEREGGRWLAVGRVSPNKALEHTIAALAVTRAHGDPAATLCVVGKPDPANYDDALHRYVAELGLTDVVTFTGHMSDASVMSAYATADVLVVTSDHEGFCVPVVEAMAAGLPVVAFDQGAIAEVMGEAGTLVTSRNPYDLAAAINSLGADAPRREAFVEAGRRRIAALDLEKAADRLADLTCALLDRSEQSR